MPLHIICDWLQHLWLLKLNSYKIIKESLEQMAKQTFVLNCPSTLCCHVVSVYYTEQFGI